MNLNNFTPVSKVRTKITGLLISTGEIVTVVNKFDTVESLRNEDIFDTDQLRDHIAKEMASAEVFTMLAETTAKVIYPRQYAMLDVQVTVVPEGWDNAG